MTVALARHEMDLLQRGLEELLYARPQDHALAEQAHQLLGRLREASAANLEISAK
jgi:hypothetical protein